MSFQIHSLPAARFADFYGKSDSDLRALGVITQIADSKPGFPCRVSLCDAEPGTRMLLLNFEHQPAATPYRSAHAIYVAEDAREAKPGVDEIPDQLRSRLISARAFSADGMLLDADVAQGDDIAPMFERLLASDNAAYLHAHFARFGCYAARVDRA
ncbi:MAG: DUF1203 domain-containing protein [Alphaproteobacteria bacterium]|nr:DUF1203 domain-containing protein [Alphaproteobacteria bacterium]